MPSDSETEVVDAHKRESKRLKIAALYKEVADNIVGHFESIDEFFSNGLVQEEGVIEQFHNTLEEWLVSVSDKYTELDTLTENTIDEATIQMYHVFCDLLKEKRAKLQEKLEQFDMDREFAHEEAALQETAQAYNDQLKKFHFLVERMKLHKDITPRSETPMVSQLQGAQQQLLSPTSSQQGGQAKVSMTSQQSTNQGLDAVKELAQSLVTTMKASKRAMPEPPIYDGNPIEFQDWEMDFDAFVDSEGLTGVEPLRFLKRFLKGKAKEAISGHFITNTVQAYADARKELRHRFGSKHNVNRALRIKLDSWPKVPVHDATALRRYADFLLHVNSAMKDIPELHSLSLSQENEKLACKLPDWLIRLWARKVKDKRNEEQSYPTFSQFTSFVVDHAEVADEPLMQLSVNRSKERKPKNAPDSGRVKTFSTTLAPIESCRCCNKTHPTAECFQLSKMANEKKTAFVRENRLCWGCLQNGHQSKDCSKRATCKKCKKRHPTSLHKDDSQWTAKSGDTKEASIDATKQEKPDDKSQTATAKTLNVKATGTKEKILSMVVPVHLSSKHEPTKETLVYAMLDTQSDSSYITSNTAKAIGPRFTKETVTMDTLQGENTVSIRRYQDITIRGWNQSDTTSLEAYEWDRLICAIEKIPNCINVAEYPHLKSQAHKLPPPLDIEVGMLIGANCPEAFAPLEAVVGKTSQPFAQRTMLGWSVFGATKSNDKSHKTSTKAKATRLLFNDQDEQTMLSQDDFKFLETMEKKLHVNNSGHFEGPLPFRRRPTLPNNRLQAEKRLQALKKKMDADSAFKENYSVFMRDLLKRGHAEPIKSKPSEGQVWYIPHFAVSHPQKKKLRVVFDCSASFGGVSLNDHLLSGPDLTNNMLGILLRFRKEQVAIACDIERMFYNFYVNEEDRDFLRFLWFDECGNIEEYRMTVHLFGATSSPAVATHCLQKLARDNKNHSPTAANFIQQNFYVDDGITSVPTTSDAKKLISDARTLCERGNLRLHKFLSNKMEVLDDIPESERSVKDVDLLNGSLPIQRTLGLEWSIEKDILKYNSKVIEQKSPTRRGILSMISQIFDPLGFLAPYTLTGKNILQQVNKAGYGWDEVIGEDTQELWKNWTKDLKFLDEVQVPRCIRPSDFRKTELCELHHFCDASMDGMGACSYLRCIDDSGNVHTCLLLAKSRVVPSKGIMTVPRLELQSAVMATRLGAILRKELDMVIDGEHFWTDSKIVLAYLANEQKRFHIYVANRIQEIKMSSDASQWHHVGSNENPADIASRGMSCSKLLDSMWFSGPAFLKEHDIRERLNTQKNNKELDSTDPEIRKVKDVKTTALKIDEKDPEVCKVQVNSTKTTESSWLNDIVSKASSWTKLTKVLARIYKIGKERSLKVQISPADIVHAEELVIKTVQFLHFSKEIEQLHNSTETSSMRQLSPYLDDKGLVRVGGRLENGKGLTKNHKHPVIIPKKSHLAKIITRDYHEAIFHLGRRSTLAAIRDAGFWIVNGSNMVKSILSSCVGCAKLRKPAGEQKMSPLPEERLEKTPPFTNVGIDVFGPFYTKDKRTENKRWGLLFTCLYSRAIHIEMLEDLSSDAFLNALQCFTSIRGPIKTLISDHGTNFVGAANELKRQLSYVEDESLKNYLLANKVEFKFTSPTGSHQGGVWERMIRSVREVLRGMALKYKGRIDTQTLRTCFYEAMSIVNNRPLTALDINDPDENIITPNSLLTMKSDMPSELPPGNFDDDDLYGRLRWKKAQCFAQEFWLSWRQEYLSYLTLRQKWSKTRKNVTAGDIVMLVEQDTPRGRWKLGVVEEAILGKDCLIRRAKVRIGTSDLDKNGKRTAKAVVLERPIQKLIKLM
ncbi:uncharacterized protein [Watersipora subatra]|uniref:uncharacterized protein n=1 Tax=Watersipora subatra TaxID=2589382 RepID=UPI00355C4A39